MCVYACIYVCAFVRELSLQLDNVPPSDPFYDDDVMVKAVPAGTTVVGALGSNEVTPPVSESDLILLEAQVARKKRELAQLELAVSQTRQSLGLPPPLAAANASSAGTSSSSASSGGFPTVCVHPSFIPCSLKWWQHFPWPVGLVFLWHVAYMVHVFLY